MTDQFQTSLHSLQQKLLSMGGMVEQAIETAVQSILSWDPTRLQQVDQLEERINRCHLEIDEACIRLLATQRPFATDLRLIIAILKINTDLERMGDQAVNIARNSERYLQSQPLKSLSDLPELSVGARQMVRESLDSFTHKSREKASQVLGLDDRVDELKNKIFKDLIAQLKNNPGDMEQGMNLILIARNLERIGDHATNIAEDVIYAVTGEDVRHGHRSA